MAAPPTILVAVARYYPDIADQLVAGAVGELERQNAPNEVVEVPGAFELPGAIRLAHDSGEFDGYVALGCVIRGETSHYDHVAGESARALADLAARDGCAIGYGIVTADTRAQAWERAATDRRDKGRDAAQACLAMVALRRRFAAPATPE
ncbi:MAG: 6,7-dimethyl-8-ribityllumazine synthase [Alphaproteobacteria bacterium]|jgi:6,7-dimethyl-8-ribityllumazine synthase|nr:6,7-dimethyl-8-ribityllumazine synthase [Alphaproteobacteria bacterium]MDP6515477.1 6,7-dimethyl-8-ribityllumazine synthase [Alphaproteobacteria bacterium]